MIKNKKFVDFINERGLKYAWNEFSRREKKVNEDADKKTEDVS